MSNFHFNLSLYLWIFKKMDHLNTQFIKLAQKETLLWFQSIIKDPSISIESIQKLNKIFERLISPNLINPVGQLKTVYKYNQHLISIYFN